MTSPRIMIAAGSIAATLAGIVPALPHGTSADPATSSAAVSVRPEGVAVSAARLRAGVVSKKTFVVPQGVAKLTGATDGSPALAARVRLTVVRTSDHATLFSGSLSTFAALPVVAGDKLQVRVQRPAGFAGLRATATLDWS